MFLKRLHSASLTVNDDDSFHPQEAFEINPAAATVHEVQRIAVFVAATIADLLRLSQQKRIRERQDYYQPRVTLLARSTWCFQKFPEKSSFFLMQK